MRLAPKRRKNRFLALPALLATGKLRRQARNDKVVWARSCVASQQASRQAGSDPQLREHSQEWLCHPTLQAGEPAADGAAVGFVG